MKRDLELCRAILLEVEKRPYKESGKETEMAGYAREDISYQIKLMHEAGLLEARNATTMGPTGFLWLPMWLTWHGHEFLDASRVESRWEQAKALIRDKAGEVGFDVLKAVLSSLATRAVGL